LRVFLDISDVGRNPLSTTAAIVPSFTWSSPTPNKIKRPPSPSETIQGLRANPFDIDAAPNVPSHHKHRAYTQMSKIELKEKQRFLEKRLG
jgi:hypothetical protein